MANARKVDWQAHGPQLFAAKGVVTNRGNRIASEIWWNDKVPRANGGAACDFGSAVHDHIGKSISIGGASFIRVEEA